MQKPATPESRQAGAPAAASSVIERNLSAAARRALSEAAERKRRQGDGAMAAEIGGRGGLEPVRYGDWEVKGLASDF